MPEIPTNTRDEEEPAPLQTLEQDYADHFERDKQKKSAIPMTGDVLRALQDPDGLNEATRLFFENKRRAKGENRIKLSVELGLDMDAQRQAKIFHLQRMTNLPREVIEGRFDQIEREAEIKGMDLDKLIIQAPRMIEFMAEDPAHVALIRDDVADLAGIEWLVKSAAAGFMTGLDEVNLNIRSTAPIWTTLIDKSVGKLAADIGDGDVPMNIQVAKDLQVTRAGIWSVFGIDVEDQDKIDFLAAEVNRDFGASNSFERGWVGFARMVPQILGSVAAAGAGALGALGAGFAGPQAVVPEEIITVPTGARLGVMSWSAMQEMGGAYRILSKLRDEDGNPIDEDLLVMAAMASGAAGGMLETLGLNSVTKLLPGGKQALQKLALGEMKRQLKKKIFRQALKKYAADYLKAGATEAGTEMLQDLMPILAGSGAKMVQGGEWKPEDIRQNMVDMIHTGVQTLEIMAVGGVFLGGPTLGVDVVQARRVQRNQARLKLLANSIQNAEMREKDPEKFAELIEKLVGKGPDGVAQGDLINKMLDQRGAIDNVFIPLDKIDEVFGEKAAEAMAAITGSTEAYEEAQRVGANEDVTIPFARFLSEVVTSESYDKLSDHVRLYQGDLTQAEYSGALKENQATMERIAKEASERDVDTYDTVERTIYDDVRGQMIEASGSEEQADALARMRVEITKTLAERNNRDPLEIYNEYKVRIRRIRAAQGAQLVTQAGTAVTELTTEPDVADLAARVRAGEPEAVQLAAAQMAGLVGDNATLVPVPSESGDTTANTALAEAVAELTGGTVRQSTARHLKPQTGIEREGAVPARTAPTTREAFLAVGDEQRNTPERAMNDIQRSDIAQLFGFLAEHTGDIIHRMSDRNTFGSAGFEFVGPKVRRVLSALRSGFGVEREINGQIAGNVDFRNERSPGGEFNTVKSATAELRRLGQAYADAHAALRPVNNAQRLAQKAAVAIGEQRYRAARVALTEIEAHLGSIQQWVAFAQQDIAEIDQSEGAVPARTAPATREATPTRITLEQASTRAPTSFLRNLTYEVEREGEGLNIIVSKDGKELGTADYSVEEDHLLPVVVTVDQSVQRRGVASYMAALAENISRLPVGETTVSDEGAAFRAGRKFTDLELPDLGVEVDRLTEPAAGSPAITGRDAPGSAAVLDQGELLSVLDTLEGGDFIEDEIEMLEQRVTTELGQEAAAELPALARTLLDTDYRNRLREMLGEPLPSKDDTIIADADNVVLIDGVRRSGARIARLQQAIPGSRYAAFAQATDLTDQDRDISQDVDSEPATRKLYQGAVRADDLFLDHEPARDSKGKIKGGPEWVNRGKSGGAKTQKLNQLRALLDQLMLEGEAGRFWYEDSARRALAITGGDVVQAEKFIQLLAIYSPNTAVASNTVAAVRAYNHWRNDKNKTDRAGLHAATDQRNEKARALLYDGVPWSGRKTNSFYLNLMSEIIKTSDAEDVARLSLDPEISAAIADDIVGLSDPATVDVWILRAFGYERDSAGFDKGAGKYSFAENEIRRITSRLNSQLTIGEPRWEVHQVQAALWTAIKARFEITEIRAAVIAESVKKGHTKMVTNPKTGKMVWQAPQTPAAEAAHVKIRRKHALAATPGQAARSVQLAKDSFADTLARMSYNVTWEALPSGALAADVNNASPAGKVAFTKEALALLLDDVGDDKLAAMLGVQLGWADEGTGAYDGLINTNVISGLIPTRIGSDFSTDTAALYAAAIQFIFKQEAVPFFRADKKATPLERDFAVHEVPGTGQAPGPARTGTRSDTIAEAQAHLERLQAKHPDKTFAVRGGKFATGVKVVFREDLTSLTEVRFFQLLRRALGQDIGYTRMSPREIVIVNFRDGETGIPFAGEDADFLSSIGGMVKTYGEAIGIDSAGHFGAHSEYGPVHDWTSDPEGGAILQRIEAAAGGRPDVQPWVRGRADAFGQLLQRWSGDELAEREREVRAGGAFHTTERVRSDADLVKTGLREPGDPYSTGVVAETARVQAARQLPLHSEKGSIVLAGTRKGGVRVLLNRVRDDFEATGFIDLRGTKVQTAEELAYIARVFRDPRFETFRIYWVKDGKIVAHEAITSKMPSQTGIRPASETDQQNTQRMKGRMARLGADGYWLSHNHPSGDVTPSQDDVASTRGFERDVPGFLGHVVTDHGTYSSFAPHVQGRDAPRIPILRIGKKVQRVTGPDPTLHSRVPGGGMWDETKISNIQTFARVALKLKASAGSTPETALVIYTDATGVIRAAEDVPTGLFNRRAEFADHVRGRKRAYGASLATAYLDSDGQRPAAKRHIADKTIDDAVYDPAVSYLPNSMREKREARPGRKRDKRDAVTGAFRLYQDDGKKRGYIEFTPGGRRFDIGLFEGSSDPTTVFHETAHFYLELLGDLATEEGASDQIKSDFRIIMKELGVTGRADMLLKQEAADEAGNPNDGPLEKFALMFEEYLRQGIAPTVELRDTMSRIRSWMLMVYGNIKEILRLTPEMKGVFDRMLATEPAIKEARNQLRLEPIPALMELMSPSQRAEYEKRALRSQEAANDEVRKRALAENARNNKEWWERESTKVRSEVEDDFAEQPKMRALAFLQTGRMITGDETPESLIAEKGKVVKDKEGKPVLDEQGNPRRGKPKPVKLSKKDILKTLKARGWKRARAVEAMRRMPRPYVYTAKAHGRAADYLAPLLGFKSGEVLIDAMQGAEKYEDMVDAEMRRRMDSRFGNILEDDTLFREQVLDSVQNDEQVGVMITELRVLARNLDPSGRLNKYKPFDRAQLKKKAERAARQKKVGDLRPHVYQQRAQKYGTEAFNAAQRGDLGAAHDAKMRQLWEQLMYRAVRDQLDTIDKGRRYLDRLGQPASRKRIGKAGADYLEQIDNLRERYELKRKSEKAIRRRQSLAEWIAKLDNESFEERNERADLVVDDRLLDESRIVNYRQVTADEFMSLIDTVKSIERLARLKTTLLTAGRRRDFEEVKGLLIGALRDNVKPLSAAQLHPDEHNKTKVEELRATMQKIDSRLIRIEELIRRMDGGQIDGPWREFLFSVVEDAQAAEGKLLADVVVHLIEAFEELPRSRREGLFKDEVDLDGVTDRRGATTQGVTDRDGKPVRITRQAMLTLALNTGSESNLQRLQDSSYLEWDGWSPEVIGALFQKNMTEADWKFVQGIWDTLESLWPQIAELERRTSGVAPPKIPPTARVVKTSDGKEVSLRGGYFPLVYHDLGSRGAGQRQIDSSQSVTVLFDHRMAKAMTPHGHTIKRVQKFAAPLSMNLNHVTRHLTQVVHDLTHREALISINKILEDDEIFFEMARHIGKARANQFKAWLRQIARDTSGVGDPFIEGMLGSLRMNLTVAAMGFKWTVIIQNLANFSLIGEGIRARHLATALRDFYPKWNHYVRLIEKKSPEMRDRFKNLERDIRQNALKLVGKSGALVSVQRFGFEVIAWSDMLTAYPAWLAAYRQAIDDGHNEELSIRAANSHVRTRLSSGAAKDLAGIQTMGGEGIKFMTMFYGFFSTAYSAFRRLGYDVQKSKEEGSVIRDFPSWLARIWAFWLVPALFAEWLANRGPDSDDPDDPGWIQWMLTKALLYPAMTIPLVRDAAGILETQLLEGRTRDVKFGPVGLFDEIGRSMGIVGQALDPDADVKMENIAKRGLRLTSLTVGIPASQTEVTAGYLYDVWRGRETPESIGEFANKLLYRRPPKNKRN